MFTFKRGNTMLKESDILHENGAYWIMKDKHEGKTTYTIMLNGLTHSESIDGVTYPDLSIAKARCDYMALRKLK